MSTNDGHVTRFGSVLGLASFTLALAACGGGGGGSGVSNSNPGTTTTTCAGVTLPNGFTPDVVVSASKGNDASGAGTCSSPYKTINKALSVALATQKVWVAPGTYDTVNGETFPLLIPDHVSLFGDELHKGNNGYAHTEIIGGGLLAPPSTAVGATLIPGVSTTIAGFIIFDSLSGTENPMSVYVRNDDVILRNNTVANSPSIGIYLTNASSNHLIENNVIVGNGTGIAVVGGAGSGTVIQKNTVYNNYYGITLDNLGPDLGGGAAGSVGQNQLACNAVYDLWNSGGGGVAVPAANNFWDHVPPTEDTTREVYADIYLGTASLVTATNAALTTIVCP